MSDTTLSAAERAKTSPDARPASQVPGDYLGPGRVLETTPTGGVLVSLEEGSQVEVSLALAFAYQPSPGDSLLVAGRDRGWYAIGVLAGSGSPNLSFEGDVDLHAVGGTLTLSGDEGVEVEGREVTLSADTLRTFAGSLSEKADEAYRWVTGLVTLRAGQSRRVIEGEDYNQSQDSIHLAKGTVKIDGHQIHMGH
tara:strand:+ start:1330 stop:1914 length:585 start_codon:yes stop_codon:yes gene_type:complete